MSSVRVTPELLNGCKRYLRVDFTDDDNVIEAMLGAAYGYLDGAGATRDIAPAQYDLIAHNMVLQMYDGRDDDAAQAATAPLVRQMLTQLKLRSAYGGEVSSDATGA